MTRRNPTSVVVLADEFGELYDPAGPLPAGSELIGKVGRDTASDARAVVTASSTTSAVMLAANLLRKGMTLQNTDANALYLSYGVLASSTAFTVKIAGNDGYFEMPSPIWLGAVSGVWAADGTGSAYITEVT